MKSQIAATITALALATTGAAFPTIPNMFQPLRSRNDSDSQLLQTAIETIDPETTVCDRVTYPECRTAHELAPSFQNSLNHYGVTGPGAIAAVVALTLFESVGYKHKHNVYPGRAGQGTANMQMFAFNLEYARSIDELAGAVAALGIQGDGAGASDATMNQLLALVQPDQYNFGSGPWYLKTKCPETLAAFNAGDDLDATWSSYMTACVGTTEAPERTQIWDAAKAAFGVA